MKQTTLTYYVYFGCTDSLTTIRGERQWIPLFDKKDYIDLPNTSTYTGHTADLVYRLMYYGHFCGRFKSFRDCSVGIEPTCLLLS